MVAMGQSSWAKSLKLLAGRSHEPQMLDLQADRRLRQVETARRGGKAAKFHHVGEGLQMIEAEATHGPKYCLSIALFQ